MLRIQRSDNAWFTAHVSVKRVKHIALRGLLVPKHHPKQCVAQGKERQRHRRAARRKLHEECWTSATPQRIGPSTLGPSRACGHPKWLRTGLLHTDTSV